MVQLGDQRVAERVQRRRAVQGDERHAPAGLDPDVLVVHGVLPIVSPAWLGEGEAGRKQVDGRAGLPEEHPRTFIFRAIPGPRSGARDP
ncbi:hypothetical protein mvi_31970 [Methylobacterium indicum]|uniref:Uncharacterized protein n=1 Tax=Methylobacterium indicum TaxID=1775910 RepID=A0A8H9C7I4_9HYPH|nr:hypothetical protein mvi_31970 [Methylobacterium indicum]